MALTESPTPAVETHVRHPPFPRTQNLGDEGTAYVVEALAFNNVCRALDLSKNGIGGGLGAAALCQVRCGAEQEDIGRGSCSRCGLMVVGGRVERGRSAFRRRVKYGQAGTAAAQASAQ